MLKKILLLISVFAITIVLILVDIYLFYRVRFVFYFHTLAAVVIGSSLAYLSAYFIKKKKNRFLYWTVLIIGLVQITVHVVMIIKGRC